MTHQEAVSTLASERYLLEEMTELERHAFEDHFFDCAECAEDVRAGAYLREGARSGMAGQSGGRVVPSSTVVAFPAKRAPRRVSTFVPWAAAATLALISGYQALFLGGRNTAMEPQALAPVTLRPASRGAEPVVVVDADKPVALAIDVNIAANSDRPAAELTYDLRTIDGPSILSGRAPAPEAGAPLFLLVPGASLKAPGRYLLTVADSTGQAIGEYRFAANTR
jgi:hypothetical protein